MKKCKTGGVVNPNKSVSVTTKATKYASGKNKDVKVTAKATKYSGGKNGTMMKGTKKK